eukprot:CAMPEP_0176407018 /NCGR_PEP_ID=MMETSP0127-20121128/1188_1 /TAXON_ID=938130 /ORGANISM="Platyophrya macrostoma, Strain WH" /LENGTH=152 /DNA_ID=CAMNT_0017786197 /DNA_START=181 /DNA_END=635 /DNA_ORIENTATION=+
MYSVPLEHGAGYISLGFVFGPATAFEAEPAEVGDSASKNLVIAYLSDVSAIPEASMTFLQSLKRIDLLVVDLLLGPGETHFSHYCWNDAWNLVRVLRPVRVHGTGMFCTLEHEATNKLLAEQLQTEHKRGNCEGVEAFELAYDGLSMVVGAA